MQTNMTEPTRGIRALILAAIVLCITVSLTGAKAGQDKAGLKVALVDIERISSEYKFNINAAQALQKQLQINGLILRTMEATPLLPEADHKVLADLVTAENGSPNGLTAAQKEQRQKLLDKSKGMIEDSNGLQQKVVGQLNAQDKQKMTNYAKAQADTAQRYQTIKSDLEQKLQQQANNDRTKALKTVRETIAKIAKEKGITLVLSNEIAWFAENDLTDDALKALNK
jgi:Skp family chaperone for outer membrane proteins